MEVVLQMCESLGIMKKYVGVAGLKDKKAITRQRISVPTSAVEMNGGVEVVRNALEQQEGVSILEIKWFDQGLRVGDNVANTFQLKIVAQKELFPALKDELEKRLQKIREHGFPNYYGMQRFGKGLKNLKMAQSVIDDGQYSPGEYVSKFVLQAYQNFHFNKYVTRRREHEDYMVTGDILVDKSHHVDTRVAYYLGDDRVMVIDRAAYEAAIESSVQHDVSEFADHEEALTSERKVSGPLLGAHALVPPAGSEAFDLEDSIYSRLNFWDKKVTNCQHFGMLARRRPLWVFPQDLTRTFSGDDLLLEFTLPTGSYATVLVGMLFEGLDDDTMVHNKLKVPK